MTKSSFVVEITEIGVMGIGQRGKPEMSGVRCGRGGRMCIRRGRTRTSDGEDRWMADVERFLHNAGELSLQATWLDFLQPGVERP